jgi:hypothetical protein
MSREPFLRACLQAYPPSVRDARGEEIVGTLLDASDGSWLRFSAEMLDLVRGGLRARGNVSAAVPLRRLIADACRLTALLWIGVELLRWLTWELEPYPAPTSWTVALPVLALVLGLIGLDRLSAGCALLWLAITNPWVEPGFKALGETPGWLDGLLIKDLVLIICLLVMIVAPRRRHIDSRRLLWLAALAAFAVLDALDMSAPAVPVLAISVFGLAAILISPRLAIAVPLWWTGLAIQPLVGSLLGRPGDTSGIVFPIIATASLSMILLALLLRHLKRRELQLQ